MLCAGIVGAQTSSSPVYVQYWPQSMDVLDYRTAYSSTSTTYYAYAHKNQNERVIMYTGTGIYAQNLPSGTVSSVGLVISDDMRYAVNSKSRKMYVVQQLQQGYYLLEVVSMTKVIRSGSQYLVQAPNYTFAIDTNNLAIGYQLALAGSESSVSLTNYGLRANCRTVYSFRRTPYQAGQNMAEFEMIPGVGIVSERSGRDAAEMQAQQIMLWGVNGLPLDDYLRQNCQRLQSTSAILPPPPPPPSTGVVIPDARPGDASYVGPLPAGTVVNSPISGYPMVNCPIAIRAGYHIVQPKETLNGIARYYGVTAKQIMTWNGIKDANKISICQELKINATADKGATGTSMNVGPAPAGGTTVIRQNTNNSSFDARTIALPPNPPTGNYQPVQPAPSQSVPDLLGNGTYYQSPSPVLTSPGTVTNSITTTYHTVKPKEGVLAIARKYGCPEATIRQLNGFPAKGDVGLKIGQQVVVCVPSGTTSVSSNPVPSTPPLTTVTSNPVGTISNPTPAPTTPNNGTRQALGWIEYMASGTESLNDIASKRGYSNSELAEIATLNGVSNVGAKLPLNTRITLPIYDSTSPGSGSFVPPANTPAQTVVATQPPAPTMTTPNPPSGGLTTPNAGASTASLPALTYGDGKKSFVPLGGATTPATQPTATTNTPTALPASLTVRTPIKWEFYYPRDAESLNEIGRKRKYNPSELAEIATVNGITDNNKPLPPGSKIELPVYKD
jgi:LysM repeat protein